MPRLRDIEAQLASVKAAEPSLDQPQLDVIREIIHLRRQINPTEHMARLRSLLDDGRDELLCSFSTRWLVSIADSYADFGSCVERGNAMIIVVQANVTRLAETERLYLKDPQIDVERQQAYVMPGTPLWDGMVSYAIKHGDMPINMWTRARALLKETPILSRIFEIVLSRMLRGDTVIGRLGALNQNFCELVEPFPYWDFAD